MADARSLEGRVALVTGSGRNIGRATILELASRGADVVTNARSNREEAESVAQEARDLGVRAAATVADVADQAQVNAMVSAALNEFGRVDILVNNAGLRDVKSFTDMTLEDWRYVNGVNMDGPFFCSKAVVPGMIERGWGRIINVSGLNAFKGRSDWAHVCAGKMGALGMTRALSVELAPSGINVNHIVPGAYDTSRSPTQERFEQPQRVVGIPVGRLGLPEELAKACAFLASDEASFVTGQTIHVNGGAFAG
ncbi:MAG TPA: SDR family oxidoreductase [Dehalococcoidia bacterium]|jgi:3-oxoacyl-[acyl-carrier protein] reductase|nr:3-oxoacyl-ACP reductase FabG [SAR202 cluster bacterium]HIA16275.1 SDR family oxidoreductase [Dehalococcoidia bacterium]